MTAAVDRGGLNYVKPNIKSMFLLYEETFPVCQNKELFNMKCVKAESIFICFYDTLYYFDISKNILEDTCVTSALPR